MFIYAEGNYAFALRFRNSKFSKCKRSLAQELVIENTDAYINKALYFVILL